MPLDHLLEMEHIDLAARCYTAEVVNEALREVLQVMESLKIWEDRVLSRDDDFRLPG